MIDIPQLTTTDLGSPLETYMRNMVTQMLVSMSRTLRDDDLTLPQLAALHLVDIQGQIRIGEIASQLLVSMPAASRIVSDMVARGIFERREDPTDRRARSVSLSPAGRALIDTVSHRRIEEATHTMSEMEGEVSRQFTTFFGQLMETGMHLTPDGAEPRLIDLPRRRPLDSHTITLRTYRKLAQNNRLANHRLHEACIRLGPGEFTAPRVSFFPTIKMTLNHILTVDWFYVDALEGGQLGEKAWENEEPFDNIEALIEAQRLVDERLLAFIAGLDDARLAAPTYMHRNSGIKADRTDDLLLHLFLHQTHHRGQVHAMLSSSSVPPPQLDEFVMTGDSRFRGRDLAALGWTEADLMG